MADKSYKINEVIDVVYQSANAVSGIVGRWMFMVELGFWILSNRVP